MSGAEIKSCFRLLLSSGGMGGQFDWWLGGQLHGKRGEEERKRREAGEERQLMELLPFYGSRGKRGMELLPFYGSRGKRGKKEKEVTVVEKRPRRSKDFMSRYFYRSV